MKGCAIILDLDYTIFQTNTIEKNVFAPFFENLINDLNALYSEKIIENIVVDLWKDSWDVVIEKYKIPKNTFKNSLNILDSLTLNLEIKTYSDYHFIEKFSTKKFLVTTGLTSLQHSKIKALKIENDFEEIIINDRLVESKTKLEIFKELVEKYNLNPKRTYVIGDNPNSEIEAGNNLNLTTIQILREGIEKGNNANYYIKTFEELKNIITEE